MKCLWLLFFVLFIIFFDRVPFTLHVQPSSFHPSSLIVPYLPYLSAPILSPYTPSSLYTPFFTSLFHLLSSLIFLILLLLFLCSFFTFTQSFCSSYILSFFPYLFPLLPFPLISYSPPAFLFHLNRLSSSHLPFCCISLPQQHSFSPFFSPFLSRPHAHSPASLFYLPHLFTPVSSIPPQL